MSADAPGPTFEEARQELEGIVARLERGDAELESVVALAARGAELLRICTRKLDAAQGTVEELAAGVRGQTPPPA